MFLLLDLHTYLDGTEKQSKKGFPVSPPGFHICSPQGIWALLFGTFSGKIKALYNFVSDTTTCRVDLRFLLASALQFNKIFLITNARIK